MNSCGTQAWISAQDEHWPFKTTLFFLLLRKSSKILIISPQIPFSRSLKTSPSCHTLSKALVMLRNIHPTNFEPLIKSKWQSLFKWQSLSKWHKCSRFPCYNKNSENCFVKVEDSLFHLNWQKCKFLFEIRVFVMQ